MDLRKRFGALDDNLKLDPDERRQAQDLHNELGDLLVTAGVAKRTRLQGSFRRKTMLPPLHDVDKVIELDDDLVDQLDVPAGPRKAMSMIEDVVRAAYPESRFEVKRHALGIELPDCDFAFDAVPAINPEDGSGWIKIANTEVGLDDDPWSPSNTYRLIEVVAERNQACDGLFVVQVRMAKQIIHQASLADDLPGLHVETFTYHAVDQVLDHPVAMAAVLHKAVELLGHGYWDPTGADPISERLNPAQCSRAQMVLEPLAAKAAEAVALADQDRQTEAAHLWADLFGGSFPRPTDAQERSYLRDLSAGAAAVAGAQIARPTRAWRP